MCNRVRFSDGGIKQITKKRVCEKKQSALMIEVQ